MEPSHSQILVGAAEECHSCESGWTIYLGSPTQDDHSDDDDDEEQEGGGGDRKACDGAEEDDESDDSMASDASSGPSHHIGYHPWGNKKGNQLVKEKVIAERKVEKKGTAFMYHKDGKVGVEKVTTNHCIRKSK